jgi:ABC-type transport system substrate-binding protein
VVIIAREADWPGYSRIEFHGFGGASESDLWKRLLAQDVDLLPYIPAQDYRGLARYSWIRRWATLAQNAVVLRWTLRRPQSRQLVRAVGLAIDRSKIVERLGDGITPLVSRFDLKEQPVHDPEAARSLLREAGFRFVDGNAFHPDGTRVELRLALIESFPDGRDVALLLERDLERIGILTSVTELPIGELLAGRAQEDLTLAIERIPERPDPQEADHPETALYRWVLYGASTPGVCQLRETSRYGVLPFLERARPCPAP